MDVRPVDPRDIEWEDEDPVFRVVFWRRQSAPPHSPPEHMGYEARELEISGGDVDDVIGWARGEARPDETWTLHVVVRCPDLELGQVWLAGTDPTTHVG